MKGGRRRDVLLVIDNSFVHPINICFANVCLGFLPLNCSLLLLPVDQGITNSVKVHFRRRLVKQLLINLYTKMETTINVRQSSEMITGA